MNDVMLSGDFKSQIVSIVRELPLTTQFCCFSATLSSEVLETTSKFMNDPVKILMPPQKVTLEGIKQYYLDAESEELKFECLCNVYERVSIDQAIIFANKIEKVEWLAQEMTTKHFTVGVIHGEMDQNERNSIMRDFRKGNTRVLIATDVIARGIDVQQVSLVINYELPLDHANYIHRIGRTGRFARKGTAINLLKKQEYQSMKKIERFYGIKDLKDLPYEVDNL